MFQNFILHLFEHKGMLTSSHNLHYIWICQEKQEINFSKIAFFKGLQKKCFCKPLVKKLIWMDPNSNSKLCGNHFECPYITLEYFFDPFLSFLEKMFWISYCFLMMISRTQVLGPSLKAWFIHPMRTIWIKFLLVFNSLMYR